jgi:hypothetical protein
MDSRHDTRINRHLAASRSKPVKLCSKPYPGERLPSREPVLQMHDGEATIVILSFKVTSAFNGVECFLTRARYRPIR